MTEDERNARLLALAVESHRLLEAKDFRGAQELNWLLSEVERLETIKAQDWRTILELQKELAAVKDACCALRDKLDVIARKEAFQKELDERAFQRKLNEQRVQKELDERRGSR